MLDASDRSLQSLDASSVLACGLSIGDLHAEERRFQSGMIVHQYYRLRFGLVNKVFHSLFNPEWCHLSTVLFRI
jgi:hypothetical protein